MDPQRFSYTSQRLTLNYVRYGNISNPPLLLIHGTRDHARSWDNVAAALTDRYCVYAPDLRGHGDSDWAIGGQYSHIDYSLDIYVLGEVIGRAPYAVIGHSLGGGVALQYAGAFPEKITKVVTIEGLGGLRTDGKRSPGHVRMRAWAKFSADLEQRQPHIYPTLEDATRRMMEANRHLSPELAAHLTKWGAKPVPGGYAWKFDNFTRARSPYEFNMEDARDLWNQIRSPILVIYGEESWGKDGQEPDLSPFHDVRSIKVEKAGHWVHHDQFATCMQHINEFLNA